MFFVAVLSLAALASAGPVIQNELQQQEIEDVTWTPAYKQLYYPYSANSYGNYRNNRYFPYYGQIKENYPFLPYNYKNIMAFPYRTNYLRSNKPEMGMAQPMIDYDSQDIYHLHDVNHHHMINNVHDFKQKDVIRKFNEMNYPYFPYSPMHHDKYMNMYNIRREYPHVNKYYGKSFEQEYVQPYVSNYYDRYWDVDYIRNYYNRNMDFTKPITNQMGVGHGKPVISKSLDLAYVKPTIPQRMEEVEYIQPGAIPKNLDLEYVQPVISKTLNVDYTTPVVSTNLGLRYVKPIISKNLDIDYIKPVEHNLNVEYVKPVISKNLEIDLVKPTSSRNLEYISQPALKKNLAVDYLRPISQLYPSDVKFVPEVSGRNLDETTFVPNYYNWDLQQGSYEGRFKRDLEAQVGTNVEQKRETPVTDLRHDTAINVDMSHRTPVTTKHHEVVAHEQTSQGVQRQDLQLNAELEHVPVQSEQHDAQQPIQRHTRDVTTQSVVVTPQYVYYPYYLNPYLPIQTPLVLRGNVYPNYYHLLLRK